MIGFTSGIGRTQQRHHDPASIGSRALIELERDPGERRGPIERDVFAWLEVDLRVVVFDSRWIYHSHGGEVLR